MNYKEPDKLKPVRDYEFAFIGGGRLPLTLENSDSVEELGDRFIIHVALKPNVFDPDNPIPPETITVFKQHVTAYIVRNRMQREPSIDELTDMKQIISNMSGTVQ